MQRSSPDAAVFELGSAEWAALPDLDVPAVLAKIDTGARTSALHASKVEVYQSPGGQRVRFAVHPVAGRADIVRTCDAPLVARRWVASSNGARELRCVVATTVQIGSRRWPIEVTLANRRSMRFAMLLGQRAILDDMIVVPSQNSLQAVIGYEVYSDGGPDDARPVAAGRSARRPRGLRIGLLGEGPVGAFWQQLADAAVARGHLVERIDVRNCRLALTRPCLEVGGRALPGLNGVIAAFDRFDPHEPAGRTQSRAFALAVLRHLEAAGCVTLNGAQALLAAVDPMRGFQILGARQIALAARSLTTGGADLELGRAIKRGGLLSALVADDRIVASVHGLDALAAAGIATGNGEDDGRGSSVRRRPTPVALSAAERRLVARAAQAVGLGLVRVDVVAGADGAPAIAGIDASPGIGMLFPYARTDAGVAIMRAIEVRARAAAVPVEG